MASRSSSIRIGSTGSFAQSLRVVGSWSHVPRDRKIERLRYLLDQHVDRRLNNHRHFLCEWRTYRDLTQDELASCLDTSTGMIAAWEAGDRGIRLQDQFRLFAALRIRPAQFFERPS